MKMMAIFLVFPVCVSASMLSDTIRLNVINTCLYQHPVSRDIVYSDIDVSAVISDENYSEFGPASYVEYAGKTIGYGKYYDGMAFYLNRKPYPISKAKFVNNGFPVKASPLKIDYFISEWGSIKSNGRTYFCVNVPFDGVGESGKHQSIKNIFIFTGDDNALYYSVGNGSDDRK